MERLKIDKIISKNQFWDRLISSCEENWASFDTIDEILSEMPTVDNEIINDAHNEGYDVGYWAGRRDHKPKWIPVTERLPAYGEEVLLSTNGDCRIGYLVPTYDERQYEWQHLGFFYFFNEIDAWMPLPKPYRSEEKE